MTAKGSMLDPSLERQALNLAPAMIRDLNGTIWLWTLGMERIYGYSQTEAVGRISHRLLQTEFPRPLAVIEAELADRGQWSGELLHRARNSAIVICSAQWVLVKDDAGNAIAVTEVSNDITSQKPQEESRRYLASIVENSEDAIIGKTLDGVVTSWNRGAEEIFGYTAVEIVGQPIATLFPPDRLVEEAMILERLRLGERLDHFETVRRRKDGTEIDVSITVSPIRGADNRVIGISKIVRDVSEKKRAELQFDRLRSELFHVSRLGTLGQMGSAIAHELNQPLSALTNYMAALRQLALNSPVDAVRVQEIADKASKQAIRAGDIIRHMRQFVSKGETDRQREDLNEVVKEAAELSLIGARQHGVVVELNLNTELPGVLIDRTQIQQVVLNLVRNAVEAMEGSDIRELEIETRRSGSTVEIRVGDTGPGLTPEVQERLFQPFMTTKQSGMGVGLSICRDIVEAHGGKIAAERKPTGVVFVVSLPLDEADLPPDPDE